MTKSMYSLMVVCALVLSACGATSRDSKSSTAKAKTATTADKNAAGTSTTDKTMADTTTDAQDQVAEQAPEAGVTDIITDDVLVRSLIPGARSKVLFKNPDGSSAKTLVVCVSDTASSAKTLSEDAKAGGVMLAKGGKLVVKNDTTAKFKDGTSLPGKLIVIECLATN